MPAGRHRKPAVARAHWAGVAALVTFALAGALPAAAVLLPPAPPAAADRPIAVQQSARGLVALPSVHRLAAHPVSRSEARSSRAELLAARLAASQHLEPVGEVRSRPAERAATPRTKPARTKPAGPSGAGRVSGAPCPDGSAVESGLRPNTVSVYRAVCAAFPSVTSWGGRSGSGDHGAGLALDIMVTGPMGTSIAGFVRDHARELGVSEVIWAQRIWTVQRSGEGWRAMEDRGSATANHYDHVHVSVFG